MIKFFQFLIVAAILFGVTLITAALVLKPRLDHQLQEWVKKTEGTSFEINFFDYGKFKLTRSGIVLQNVRARGVSRFEHPYLDPREFELAVSKVQLSLTQLSLQGVEVQVRISGLNARGGRLLHENRDDQERVESVSKMDFQTRLILKGGPRSWKEQVLKRARVYKDWIFQDKPIKNLSMNGKAVFLVDDWPISVRFHSVQNEKGEVHLEGNPEDLRIIAEMIEPKFTESDLMLASQNLIRMPKLLHFRREAEMRAVKLQKRDPEILYDVIRHIFWSYWLTKAYGAEFARRTTDAHEIGDTGNTAQESEKDRHHNALGINYAEKKMTEEQVEKMIFEDPRVIRKKKVAKPVAAKKTAALPSRQVVLP